MSTPTAVLHPFSVVTNLLLTGKSFSDGFFGDLHRQLLFTSPPCSTTHPSNHQRDAKRGDCHSLASFQLGSIITGFSHAGSKILRSMTV